MDFKISSPERASSSELDNRLGQIPELHLSEGVERIELTFNAELIGGEQVGIAPGAGKLLVKVLFVNGAEKWAVIEGNRAVLLTLGERSRMS